MANIAITGVAGFIGSHLAEKLISQDHDWRALIESLNSTTESLESFKKVALVKYVQYLAARRQAVTAIYSIRRDAAQQSVVVESDSKMRETAIFDVTELVDGDEEAFARLPKGETVEVDLAVEDNVSVLLAKHLCGLTSNSGKIIFIDDGDQPTQLRRGKNIVGRDASCDILINSSYREISRKHLIVELGDESIVRITDISSHGTSLNPRFLENTSI